MAGYYDANGHYARVMPVFSPTSFDSGNYSSTAVAPAQRLDGFQRGTPHRCPGGAVQPAPDGSRRWPFKGCDPSDDPTRPMRRFVYIGLLVAILPWIVIGIVREARRRRHERRTTSSARSSTTPPRSCPART